MFKVALVGKPNVGKSTIFNRLICHKKAIISTVAGTTRDRNYDCCSWLGRQFIVIDSGGVTKNLDLPFQEAINYQVQYAINEADVILFVLSYTDGIDENDRYIAKMLKKHHNKKIILVVNKAENNSYENNNLYLSLRFGQCQYISAEHGIGTGDLLDKIIQLVPKDEGKKEESINFCIIGRPNVGKSSLVNSILGQDRVIVSSQCNTTRDIIDSKFKYHQQNYTIIDTAGIRRKGKIQDELDKISYQRCQLAIKRSQYVVLVIDAIEGVNQQDQTVGGLIYEANIPSIIVVNKIDAIEGDKQERIKELTSQIKKEFTYISWAPIVFISAQEKKNIFQILEKIQLIKKQLTAKVSTSMLNSVIEKAQALNPPMQFKGGRISISYATQVNSQLPTFVLFCNNPKYLHFSYGRYMENQIRQAFGLSLVPIVVYYKDKNSRIRGVV